MKQTFSQALKPCALAASLVLFVSASIFPVQGILARSSSAEDQPVIHVAVYNFAHVGRAELRAAEDQATALFARAYLRIAWSEYPRKHHSASFGNPAPDFYVRILFAATVLRMRRMSTRYVLGESFIPTGTEGPLEGGGAYVFYDRVLGVSSDWLCASADVLGYAITHELGHLLLGPRHSPEGIMKAVWTFREGKLARRGELRFSPEQAAALQRAVWSLQKNPSLRASVQR